MPSLIAFVGFGPMEFLIVAVIILLLFGNRLPSVMRSMGKGIVEFKKGVNEIEDDRPDDESKDKKQTKQQDQHAGS